MKDINKPIFNLQRFQILQTKLNPTTSSLISDAYAYAWYERLYPILDDGDLHEDLSNCFLITKDQVEKISLYADSEWLEKRYHTFYEYERHFEVSRSSTEGIDIDRHSLLATFRYLYLHRTFDEPFWSTLVNPMEHPIEAGSITSDFSVDYIELV